MQHTGKLIALEGEDEQLLATQIEKLHCWLQHQGVVVTKALLPTNGPAGMQIKLHQGGRLRFDAACLAMLWLADRMDHLNREDGILSQLCQGHHVLCSQYWLYAYAHLLDRIALEWHMQINAPCREPDLTLYIDGQYKDGYHCLHDRYLRVIDELTEGGADIIKVDGCADPNAIDRACCRSISHLLSLGAP